MQPTQGKGRTSDIKRVNRGYKLREDLIKECKRVALEDERKLYEVMEDALEQYLESRKKEGRRASTDTL